MSQQPGLVALDLKKVFTAFVHNGPSQLALTVKRVGGDGLVFQGGQGVKQSRSGGLLTALRAFFLIHHRHGHRRTILVFGQGHGSDDIADHFTVQTVPSPRCQRARAASH